MALWWIATFFAAIYFVESKIFVENLSNKTWNAEGRQGDSNHFLQVSDVVVPGCIHTDYLRNRNSKLKSYYYRFNDVEYQWIAKTNWDYSTQFQVSTSALDEDEKWIVFYGVDTFATITLNGQVIGKTNNMFVTYSFNVSDILQRFNYLKVSFTSAVTEANNLAAKLSYPIPPQTSLDVQHGFNHVNLIRKEQSSFSWDWGPGFATQGIWKPIFLQTFSHAILESLSASFDWINQILEVNLRVKSRNKPLTNADVQVKIPELNISALYTNVKFIKFGGYMTGGVGVNLADVKYQLWWPNGFGDAKLYNITVKLIASSEISEKKIRFGFRRIQLIQEKIAEERPGNNFYFMINNKKIFSKGANWIPADAFHTNISAERIETLLESARLANMNMLRVWGGGIYEDDMFYDKADEKGIMLWQDLMFACAMYPSTSTFLSNVKQEIEDNLWRIKHHPSIVIWAGNNENEAALAKNWYNTNSNFRLYANDYKKLYLDTIRPLVKQLDPHRPFLTSSPTNGVESDHEGGISINPYDVSYGDVHYYNYTANCLDWNNYPRTRFASEYGFQSWPSLHSLRPVSDPSVDWDVDSDWARHRQHHVNGSDQINDQINRHFSFPKTKNETLKFVRRVWMSQIMQALCYESQTEFYLHMRGQLDKYGHGNTMGALYWQLNDIWQAPTWSSIEYSGRWKPLHYFAQKFFAPLTIIGHVTSLSVTSSQITVFLQSSLDDVINDHLIVSLHAWNDMSSKWTVDRTPVTIGPHTSKLVYERGLDDLMKGTECDENRCFISFQLQNKETPLKYVVPTEYKHIHGIKNPNIKVSDRITSEGDSKFTFEITCSYPALFVWLESDSFQGRFSDNAFIMTSFTKNITFYAWNEVMKAEKLLDSITVVSLYDYIGEEQLTWLDDITAKLVFSIVGVIFVVAAAVQFTFVVLRLNGPANTYKVGQNLTAASTTDEAAATYSHRSGSDVTLPDFAEEETAAAFLIRSKHGYGHTAKQTEFRFYIV